MQTGAIKPSKKQPQARGRGQASKRRVEDIAVVVLDVPERLPVMAGELDLLVGYLGNEIAAMLRRTGDDR